MTEKQRSQKAGNARNYHMAGSWLDHDWTVARTWLAGIYASCGLKGFGGARRDRTDDLLLAKQALSQLSYGP